jgi:hypothetical protein
MIVGTLYVICVYYSYSIERSMVEIYNVNYVSLHVRETNYAAFHLYHDTLKFSKHGLEPKYYADGENAYDMRRQINRELFNLDPKIIPSTSSSSPAATATTTPVGTKGGGEKKGGKQTTIDTNTNNNANGSATPSVTQGAEDSAAAEEEALEKAGTAANLEPGNAAIMEALLAEEEKNKKSNPKANKGKGGGKKK